MSIACCCYAFSRFVHTYTMKCTKSFSVLQR
uniref:Uncharacterized protein n=1 Tax=Anguilla anguilla TaxID=7936 RepID=A0A0E9WJG3_ANGAN